MDKRNQFLKSKIRAPMQEVILPDFPDDDNTMTTTVTKSRRVSFGTNFVKEFIVGSAVSAQCVSEYEQAFSSSDSSNPNSSHSGVESGILNQNTSVLEEIHKSTMMPPPEIDENRSVKRPKISSTICFSADSPTADMEFTEGCISLAKSILDKKNKEMTVIIQAKTKETKEEKKIYKGDETKYFEGSLGDMSFAKSFCGKENKKEEKRYECEKTKVFGAFEDEMSFTNANKIFKEMNSPFSIDDKSDESLDEDSCKENRMPLNLIIHHLDKDNSDLESSLFHPQVPLSDVLKSNLLNNSIESDKTNFNTSIFKMSQVDSSFTCEDNVPDKLPRLSSTDEMVEEAMKFSENATLTKEPTLNEGLNQKEEDSFLETLHTGVEVESEKENFEEVDMDVTFAREVISDITLTKIPPAKNVDSFTEELNLKKNAINALSKSIIKDSINNDMGLDNEKIIGVLNQLDEGGEESRILLSQSTENVPEDLCKRKENEDNFHITNTEEVFHIAPDKVLMSVDQTNSEKVSKDDENEFSEIIDAKVDEVKENEKIQDIPFQEFLNESNNKHQDIETNVLPQFLESSSRIEVESEKSFNVQANEETNEFTNKNEKMKELEEQLSKNELITNDDEENVEKKCSDEKSESSINLVNVQEVGLNNSGTYILQQSESVTVGEVNDSLNCKAISAEIEMENQMKLKDQMEMKEQAENEDQKEVEEDMKIKDCMEMKEQAEIEYQKEMESQMEMEDEMEIESQKKTKDQLEIDCQMDVEDEVELEVETKGKGEMEMDDGMEVEESVKTQDLMESSFDKNGEELTMSICNISVDNNENNFEKEVTTITNEIIDGFEQKNTEGTINEKDGFGSKIEGLINETNLENDANNTEGLGMDLTEEKVSNCFKEPSLFDTLVIQNLKEQSKEPGCIWTLDEVKYPQSKAKGFLSCGFDILESKMNYKFYLKSSEEDALGSCSFVCGGDARLKKEDQLKVPDYWVVLDLGYKKLKEKFEEELKPVKTIRQVPYFLDQINFFSVKMNTYLRQILSVLTSYPGSTLEGSKLSFRLFSFPLLFSWTVSIDLKDLSRLSRSSILFDGHFGELDKNQICEIFQECSQCENAICEFVVKSTEYVINLEKKTGFRSKRQHIELLPKHFTE